MHVAIAHNAVTKADNPDSLDVLYQVESVEGALARLGHTPSILPCSLDLESAWQRLQSDPPAVVFNLVESLADCGQLIHLFPFMLDAMGLPYSGASAIAILTTSEKTAAKQKLMAAGLPTPEWIELDENTSGTEEDALKAQRWIIKSVWEHASVGINNDALLTTNKRSILTQAIMERAPLLGGKCFAESYIEGREFNISILAGTNGPEVLPPAEIRFDGYGADRPRIVDYKAKWDESSFEYQNTKRSFDFAAHEAPLLNILNEQALDCWHLFGLNGYARIDFRVDEDGNPWILEVNANPCLSPDAGFSAALTHASIPFHEAVRRILDDALPKQTRR